jgi:hypothetical protein
LLASQMSQSLNSNISKITFAKNLRSVPPSWRQIQIKNLVLSSVLRPCSFIVIFIAGYSESWRLIHTYLFKPVLSTNIFYLYKVWYRLPFSNQSLNSGAIASLSDSVDLCSALQQQDHNIHVAKAGGDMKRGLLLLHHKINLVKLSL